MFIGKEKNIANYLPTVASRFLAMADNLFTLEIPSLNTVKNLSWAYTQLIFPSKYSTKTVYQYKKLRKIFSAAIGLISLGTLLNVFVSRQN